MTRHKHEIQPDRKLLLNQAERLSQSPPFQIPGDCRPVFPGDTEAETRISEIVLQGKYQQVTITGPQPRFIHSFKVLRSPNVHAGKKSLIRSHGRDSGSA